MKETETINGLRVVEVEEVNPLKARGEFDWYGARACMGGKCIKVDSDAGAVGLITKECFFLVPNFKGDGLTRVAIVDGFPSEITNTMHFMGYWSDFEISAYDCKPIPTSIKSAPGVKYACYSRDGIVIFVVL